MILVTEYMVGGDLWNVLGHDTEQNFGWYRRHAIFFYAVDFPLCDYHAWLERCGRS